MFDAWLGSALGYNLLVKQAAVVTQWMVSRCAIAATSFKLPNENDLVYRRWKGEIDASYRMNLGSRTRDTISFVGVRDA